MAYKCAWHSPHIHTHRHAHLHRLMIWLTYWGTLLWQRWGNIPLGSSYGSSRSVGRPSEGRRCSQPGRDRSKFGRTDDTLGDRRHWRKRSKSGKNKLRWWWGMISEKERGDRKGGMEGEKRCWRSRKGVRTKEEMVSQFYLAPLHKFVPRGKKRLEKARQGRKEEGEGWQREGEEDLEKDGKREKEKGEKENKQGRIRMEGLGRGEREKGGTKILERQEEEDEGINTLFMMQLLYCPSIISCVSNH